MANAVLNYAVFNVILSISVICDSAMFFLCFIILGLSIFGLAFVIDYFQLLTEGGQLCWALACSGSLHISLAV